jgi:hypothetical protein
MFVHMLVLFVTAAVHVWLCIGVQTKPRAEKRRKRDEDDEEVSRSSNYVVHAVTAIFCVACEGH